jgi:uncharacterized protein
VISKLEFEAWQRVAGFAQSPSHDFRHIERVQAYVDQLGRILGVKTDLVRLAAILHDLGRSDQGRRHGAASLEASKEMAEEVLRHLDLSDEDRRIVVEAIETHDQPGLSPEATAGRILKDADFLAGFGAWGVLRIAMWSGETGRRIDDVIQRMTEGMRHRLDGLEYPESRDAAFREVLFARQFEAELGRPAEIQPRQYNGFYIVLEGISGTGKNTVAEAIMARLSSNGIPNRLIEEPGENFRSLRDQLKKKNIELKSNAPLKKALLMADRAIAVEQVLRPGLEKGEVVISVRSYMSTAVYQSSDLSGAYRTIIEHEWVPTCDLFVLLDTDPEIAMSRIVERQKPQGDYETIEHLKCHRNLYRELTPVFPSRHSLIMDVSKEKSEIIDEVYSTLISQMQRWNSNL